MCQNKIIIAGICLLTVLATPVSFADETVMGETEAAVKKVTIKMYRGILNTFTGWVELVRQPTMIIKEDGPIGVPIGLTSGVFMAVTRTGAGIIEALTFPFTIHGSYDSIIDPDLVWQTAE